jgi:hypothetical protein
VERIVPVVRWFRRGQEEMIEREHGQWKVLVDATEISVLLLLYNKINYSCKVRLTEKVVVNPRVSNLWIVL